MSLLYPESHEKPQQDMLERYIEKKELRDLLSAWPDADLHVPPLQFHHPDAAA